MEVERDRYKPHQGDIRLSKNAPQSWLYLGGGMWQANEPPKNLTSWQKRHRRVAEDTSYSYWRKAKGDHTYGS